MSPLGPSSREYRILEPGSTIQTPPTLVSVVWVAQFSHQPVRSVPLKMETKPSARGASTDSGFPFTIFGPSWQGWLTTGTVRAGCWAWAAPRASSAAQGRVKEIFMVRLSLGVLG